MVGKCVEMRVTLRLQTHKRKQKNIALFANIHQNFVLQLSLQFKPYVYTSLLYTKNGRGRKGDYANPLPLIALHFHTCSSTSGQRYASYRGCPIWFPAQKHLMSVLLEEVIIMADDEKNPKENTEKDPENASEVAKIPNAFFFNNQRWLKAKKFVLNLYNAFVLFDSFGRAMKRSTTLR